MILENEFGTKKIRVQTIYGGLARFGLLLSKYIQSLGSDVVRFKYTML